MPEMNLRHIDLISSDIRKQEIAFSHLMDELIDHVCCDVEWEMKQGLDFSEAYRKVKEKIGSRGLKEIQEETLFEVDTKYRKMKNTMKISGIAGTVMLGCAAVIKILHFPGAGILMTLGALITSLIFMPSAMVVLWKESHSRKQLFLFISAFLTGATFIMGILFKVQHWPASGLLITISVFSAIVLFLPSLLYSKLADNEKSKKGSVYILGFIGIILYLLGFLFKIQHWSFATILITLGAFILLAIVLPMYTWITWKNELTVSMKFIFMVTTLALFIIPGVLVSLGVQKTYEDEFFYHLDQQQTILTYRQNINDKLLTEYKDSVQIKKMELIHLKTSDLIGQIDRIEKKMIELSEESHSLDKVKSVNGKEIDYRKLSNPFNIFIVKFMLYPDAVSRVEIDKSVNSYVSLIGGNTSEVFAKTYEQVLNPASYLPDNKSNIRENCLISGLHALALFRNGILLTENDALRQIITH
jgi:hypothetical protein